MNTYQLAFLFGCVFLYANAQEIASSTNCLSSCYANNGGSFPPGCCGCCPSGSSCFGNQIAPVCCPNSQSFCGCLSNRAFCDGGIFNSTRPVPPFGTCYTPSQSLGVCCYFPSPNEWLICPAGTTCCGGVRSGPGSISCCRGNEQCVLDTAGFPTCVPSDVPPTEPTEPICSGQAYNPNTHRCINGVLCGINNGVCKGNVCYDPRAATCFPQRCAGALQGNPANDVLCGSGLSACGTVCFDPVNYVCFNGTIQQKPAVGQACGNTFCTGNQLCCQSNQAAFPFAQCYDPSTSSCARDPRAFGALATRVCPLSPFGKAQGACLLSPTTTLQCFDIDTQFCCRSPMSAISPTASVLSLDSASACPGNTQCFS